MTGDVTSGLIPGLSISVAPSGISPPEPTIPPNDGGESVPDAVPADVPVLHGPDKPIAPDALMSAASNVELKPDRPALAVPVLAQERLLAVGSKGAGLSPPGESAVAPMGIPTGPTPETAPGIPSGDVAPIAGRFGMSGANWAKLAPGSSRTTAKVSNIRRTVFLSCSDHKVGKGRAFPLVRACGWLLELCVVAESRIQSARKIEAN
jgi:hypothetical protein